MKHVLLHAGIHRTGTTSIRLFLAENRELLRSAGIFAPDASALPRDVEAGGGAALNALAQELKKTDAPFVVLSSEAFGLLYERTHLLEPLYDMLREQGYEITIVLYVRAQADFLESAYSEIVTFAPHIHPRAYLFDALRVDATDRSERAFSLDYSRLIRGFSAIAGDAIIVRPFDAHADALALLKDFVNVMAYLQMPATGLPLQASSPRAHRRMLFGEALGRMHAAVLPTHAAAPPPVEVLRELGFDPADPLFGKPLAPFTREEHIVVIEHFREETIRLETVAQIHLPGTRLSDLGEASDERWKQRTKQREILDRLLAYWLTQR